MTIVETHHTPTRRSLMRKTKDELIRWIEWNKHGRRDLSYREINEQCRAYSKDQLASECMKIIRNMKAAN